MYKCFIVTVACLFGLSTDSRANAPNPPDVDGLTDKTRPFALSGQTVFTHFPGGVGSPVNHSYHRATYLLQNNYVPLFFEVEHGQAGAGDYFKEIYRVMYITVPDHVIKDSRGGIPMPMPPFFGDYAGPIYMVGISLNKNRSTRAPAITTWLDMRHYKVFTQ